MDDDTLIMELKEAARALEQRRNDAFARQRASDSVQLDEFPGPLSPAVLARIVDHAASELDSSPTRHTMGFSHDWRQRLGGWRWAAAVTATVGALALAAVFLWPTAVLRDPLPPYGVELRGGQRTFRGPETETVEPPHLASGAQLEILLRPETAVTPPVATQVFWATGEHIRPVLLPAEVTAKGTVLLRGTVGDGLPSTPGEHTLWVVIGRPGEEVTSVEVAARANRVADVPTNPAWQLLGATVVITPPQDPRP